MRDMKQKVRCIKKQFSKCAEVVRSYDKVQASYANDLETNPNIVSFQCNVAITEVDGRMFTSDFVAKDKDGNTVIRECVWRKQLYLPRTCKLLDVSRDYWIAKGVTDWGIVVERLENEQK